mmetsp:Transcript_145600/g.378670  ORF Transcript_145600/g.378670 Transcript_145600/m.378670 type:complete len:107 (-) Transcript_145600:896-1216(-)
MAMDPGPCWMHGLLTALLDLYNFGKLSLSSELNNKKRDNIGCAWRSAGYAISEYVLSLAKGKAEMGPCTTTAGNRADCHHPSLASVAWMPSRINQVKVIMGEILIA